MIWKYLERRTPMCSTQMRNLGCRKSRCATWVAHLDFRTLGIFFYFSGNERFLKNTKNNFSRNLGFRHPRLRTWVVHMGVRLGVPGALSWSARSTPSARSARKFRSVRDPPTSVAILMGGYTLPPAKPPRYWNIKNWFQFWW